MELAGIAVDHLDVLELAERLARAARTDTVALLLIAQRSGDERVALSIEDREAIIGVLGDAPGALAELHHVLLFEHMYYALDSVA